MSTPLTRDAKKEEMVYYNNRETSFDESEASDHETKEDGATAASDCEGRLTRLSLEEKEDDREIDSSCGYGSCRPMWLQKFARPEVYAVVHGIIGFCLSANNNYNIGTLSTLEKQLKIPSKTNGFIRSAFEIGSMGTLPFMGYAARHVHPMYLLGGGTFMVFVACICFTLPHAIFGAGPQALAIAASNVTFIGNDSSFSSTHDSADRFCGTAVEEECGDDGTGGYSSTISAVILFIANVLLGVGNSAHFSVGIAYLDNNSPKNFAPILLATTYCIHMLGPTLGYGLSAFALSHYVSPDLMPSFTKEDPRWIGAWWMGWPILACLMALMSAIVLLFPKRLPRKRKNQDDLVRTSHVEDERPSLRDFKITMKRLLRNKVLMFNIISGICLSFGFEFYLIFMPKYIETQYQHSASHANIITGSIGMTMVGIGTVTAAIVITRFKPKPRTLAAWNVFTEVLAVLAHVMWAFVGCPARLLDGSPSADGSWNLTSTCNAGCECGSDVQYAPICAADGVTFFSPCHAGCSFQQTFTNGTKIFSDCKCTVDGMALTGPCPVDCSAVFTFFVISQCVIHFLEATGRSGNVLLAFRCVSERDKSLSIALGEFSLCLLAFFPAPTIYGAMLDVGCTVWGVSCGETGHCWLYDNQITRYLLNFTAAGSLLTGVIFDVAVWYYCGDLKIYDEEDTKKSQKRQQ